ncbi:MAG TPA: HEAT repeat domain-containing protein [Planctomycetota bacterium]|nr:HEAT repeat domain-containing protein [Planctomycetota bacterium]
MSGTGSGRVGAKAKSARQSAGPSPPGRARGADLPEESAPPFLSEVKDFIRLLVVAEKNYQLYPVKGKVVQQSLQSLFASLVTFHREADQSLAISVAEYEILYEDVVVLHDDKRAKSLPNRLYKDAVKRITFLRDVTIEELSDFLSCFKDSRHADDVEDDFGTLFWEKDCTHIDLEITDEFNEDEADAEIVLPSTTFASNFDPERFGIGDEEADELREMVSNRRTANPDGDSTFELTQEEVERIGQLTIEEKAYFPLYDFVEILLEFIAQGHDAKRLNQAIKLIRTIIFALIESLDFEHATGLLTRLTAGDHPGITDAHRLHLTEMARSLCDKATLQTISTFLKENAEIPRSHDVFSLMKAMHRDVVPHFCEFLTLQQHIPGITDVLLHLGVGCSGIFAEYLTNPEPMVVRAIIHVLLKTDREGAVQRIAIALKHPDEGVRLQAAKSMMEFGDLKSAPLLVHLLRERSRNLIILGIHFFSRTSCPAAFDDLVNLIKSARFADFDSLRQEQCFKALVLAKPAEAFEFIAGHVLRWRISLGNASVARKSAALKSLKQRADDGSHVLLERFARKKRGPLGSVARQILKETGEPAKPAVELKEAENAPA